MGVHSTFTQNKADEICILLEDGLSLRKAADAVGESARTILNWTKANPEFLTQYTRAREIGYMQLADEILNISDEADVEVRYDGEDTRLDLSATAVARNRLRVDTRKWMLSKMLPKVYGDKIEVKGDPDNPLQTVNKVVFEVVNAKG
jgi:hypothetical protein